MCFARDFESSVPVVRQSETRAAACLRECIVVILVTISEVRRLLARQLTESSRVFEDALTKLKAILKEASTEEFVNSDSSLGPPSAFVKSRANEPE